MSIFAGICLIVMIVAVYGSKHSEHTKGNKILALLCAVLFVFSIGYSYHINNWNDNSSNWGNLDRYSKHVTSDIADVKKVYMYHGYLTMLVEQTGFNSDEADGPKTLSEVFKYAKKSPLSKKGLLIYQKADDGNGWFIAYYNHKALQHTPSENDLASDPNSFLDNSTSYRLSDKFKNNNNLVATTKSRSDYQPQIMIDFSIDRVTPDSDN